MINRAAFLLVATSLTGLLNPVWAAPSDQNLPNRLHLEVAVDPEAVLTPEAEIRISALSESDRQEFLETQLPTRIVINASTVSIAAPLESGSRNLTSSSIKTCWLATIRGEGRNAVGATLYTFYHVASWCGQNDVVLSSAVVDAGGETSSLGWDYVGVINKSAGIISNRARSYSQTKFTFGSGGWVIQSPTPCLRFTGGPNGGVGVAHACGIY